MRELNGNGKNTIKINKMNPLKSGVHLLWETVSLLSTAMKTMK